MTLEQLRDLTCEHFDITKEEFISKARGDENTSMARHFFRSFAHDRLAVSKAKITRFEGKNPATILHSCNLILLDGVYKKEYDSFLDFITQKKSTHDEIVVGTDGIERITNEAFDDRFYKHPKRLNPRTNLPFFPAFHFLTGEGEPTPFGLIEWYKQMGYKSNEILERSKLIGSFVHDAIDRMIKFDSEISNDEIFTAFPAPKEAQKVRECLFGFINFMKDEEPIILASESMGCGEDFGYTLDNKLRIKSDKYKDVWASDWKTSKTATLDHKMQVEAIRRSERCSRGMVVVLGNATKKKYTITKISEKDHDYLWDRFLAIKDTAYVEIIRSGRIQPREDEIPVVFSLKELNFKKKI